MPIPTIEWAALTEAELEELMRLAASEHQTRQLPKRMDEINTEYLKASGRAPGKPWAQPSGGHDAYPKGWTVVHGGKTYESLVPANVWAPGQDPNGNLWKDMTTITPSDQWVPGLSVKAGDILTYEGVPYRVVQAHTTQAGWAPPVVPALWAPVTIATTPNRK